ncbi:calcium/sodium antiporter, partial [Salmonella enterica subsp. enterica serovar Weltevreden]|nr:calcium/sodium antiporter [Salmonella enterica subsp. enterica serovar Weltevreden]
MALLIIGLLLVAYGGFRLVFAGCFFCGRLGIPEMFMGLT